MLSRKFVATAIATALTLTLAPAAFAQGTTPAATSAASVDLKGAADSFLKQNAGKYALKADLSDLSYVTTIETPAGSYVRYQQTVNGAEAFYNQVTVTLDKSGNALLVVSDYTPVTSVENVKGKISENAAETAAIAHNNAKNLKAATSRKFGYLIENGVAIPTYKVLVSEEEATWETYVHAGTGKILKNANKNENVNGTGQVFLPNPVTSAGTKTGYTDSNDADSALLTSQLKTVTLQGLDGSGYLVGTYVNIYQKRYATYSSTFTYNYTRSNENFENVNVYYHLDSLQRYIQTLGFTNVNNRQIKVNVNGTTQDNSWYTPSTKELTFGTGGVDDAEDAGIVAHEYGHSIQDNQVPGFGNTLEGGAMGEGFGDYLGATYEDALDGGTYGKSCIGEWDSTSYSSTNPPCLRRLDNNKVMPGAWYGEVHEDGEIWSQGEYDMAAAFGRDIATKLILQSHFSLTPNSGFNNGAAAIKAADQLLYGGSHATQITNIWAARGISTN